MSKWRYRGNDDEDFESRDKMRVRMHRSKTKGSDRHEAFDLAEKDWKQTTTNDAFAARVVEVHKRYAFVSSEPESGKIKTNDVWLATVAKKYLTDQRRERNFICVGDRVWCRPAMENEMDSTSELPQCVMMHRVPRFSRIARLDPAHAGREHVLASNVDQMLIVASYLAPLVKWRLVDRFLVLAEAENIVPIIVLNKRDLLEQSDDESFKQECREHAEHYRSLGYEVLSIIANDDQATKSPEITRLRELLTDRVNLFCGHSGVGKSSLANLFKPEIEQVVEPNENIFYKGRHTTSYASLIKLGTGGYVVDTPGVRSFVIGEKSALDLSYCFREMRPLLGQCKYSACQHHVEPGCAVIAAVDEGRIPRWRYDSYLNILLGSTGREGRVRDLEIEE